MRLKTTMVGTSTLYNKIVYKGTNLNYAIFLRDSQYSFTYVPLPYVAVFAILQRFFTSLIVRSLGIAEKKIFDFFSFYIGQRYK